MDIEPRRTPWGSWAHLFVTSQFAWLVGCKPYKVFLCWVATCSTYLYIEKFWLSEVGGHYIRIPYVGCPLCADMYIHIFRCGWPMHIRIFDRRRLDLYENCRCVDGKCAMVIYVEITHMCRSYVYMCVYMYMYMDPVCGVRNVSSFLCVEVTWIYIQIYIYVDQESRCGEDFIQGFLMWVAHYT